ncbi:GNAT family N-acetyltransferase [Aquirufa rosea]|uniref:N-acetyltransferase n=1 Tax=Aquirufa rosea TaxID=2509241 RepID=A0A4Q1C090_9BACT|nr:GNAT family N-acetyltransferase [Aquirufa rosea]RXK49811.1 N-acetyltransferase [Aquirufa rosea]
MISIKTPRLKLIPLDHSLLVTWKEYGREALESQIGLQHNSWELEKFYHEETLSALQDFWIPMTRKFPFDFIWYTNWEIILMEKSCSIGGIGFSGLPNNEGFTEVGYCLDKKFRGKGYATEALQYAIEWASQDIDLKYLVAETPIENFASQAVLKKNQFIQTGQKTLIQPTGLEVFTWKLLLRNA